ncbi:MAG: succinate dehydrogenase, cytochrome b556 subunit [Devosiaceae bacterium]|nr:succinate dehydrogenase, cytochrome b556 subunit [Devosiaceae bacterium MH13]
MATSAPGANRPLSPHLQVYRMLFTMLMSIVHRITGAALYFGTLLMVIWLLAAASGPDAYNAVTDLYGSFLGRLVLFGFTWALMHHMLGGIRHFIWDTGRGLDKVGRNFLARATLIGSVSLTLLLWIIGYAVR